MHRLHPPRLTVIAAVVAGALAIAAAGALVAPSRGGADSGDGTLGPGVVTVELVVQHSRFSPRVVRVRPHTEVNFVVVNRDPIGHELIVGDGEVHARHETGHEPVHPPRPGEVSVGAHGRATTSYVFHEPGTVVYVCHLPGHFAYGMRGRVVVSAT